MEKRDLRKENKSKDLDGDKREPMDNEWKQDVTVDYSDFSDEQKKSFFGLLEEYQDIFAKDNAGLGWTQVKKHVIDNGSAAPIKQPPGRLRPFKWYKMDKQLSEFIYLEKGRIEPSNVPWGSLLELARKRNGTYRLSKPKPVTLKDAEPLPRFDDIFESLRGANWSLFLISFSDIRLFSIPNLWKMQAPGYRALSTLTTNTLITPPAKGPYQYDLPRTMKGNQYIMTVQCSFTKLVEAYALPNQKCARTLVEN